MADEKILKDESLNNEELENVVGGRLDGWNDYKNIKKLEAAGKGNFYKNSHYTNVKVEDAFKKIGKTLGLNLSAKIVYDGALDYNPNKYYLDGKELSRDELWEIINEGFGVK